MTAVASALTIAVALAAFLAVVAAGVWAIRQQNRLFPKRFDRTGWAPDRDRASWFRTQFTWLSGGRG